MPEREDLGGRPSQYDASFCGHIRRLARLNSRDHKPGQQVLDWQASRHATEYQPLPVAPDDCAITAPNATNWIRIQSRRLDIACL